MKTSILNKAACVGLLALSCMACKKEAKLQVNFSDRFEGQTVELMNYADSTVLATGVVNDGKVEFVVAESDSVKLPMFTNIMVDGRLRAFYIAEAGTAELTDSLSVATGTPLNDKFTAMLASLDSIENLDDMDKYVEFSETVYNENKENPFGDYFCIEWLKYADPSKVDSLLKEAPEKLRESTRVKYYENFSRHRALTAPGQEYTDIEGENMWGGKQKMSSLMTPGNYVLIDFWASWCPYCIKELPEIASLYADYHDKGLDIIGVAVRDKPEDTKSMVKKNEIAWPILYNTQKVPYDIYGFSGIPHHMFIGPDGVIISRGENIAKIRERFEEILADKTIDE